MPSSTGSSAPKQLPFILQIRPSSLLRCAALLGLVLLLPRRDLLERFPTCGGSGVAGVPQFRPLDKQIHACHVRHQPWQAIWPEAGPAQGSLHVSHCGTIRIAHPGVTGYAQTLF